MSLILSDPVHLNESEAACLEAIRSGADTKTGVALRAQLDLDQTEAALGRLTSAGLIEKRRRRLSLAPHGPDIALVVTLDGKRQRGRRRRTSRRPGPSGQRLLDRLGRPRRGTDLAEELGLSPQRIHQLAVRLSALGLVRIGDPARPLHILARTDDPSLLLRAPEEAVLSVFPETAGTTISKIAGATHKPPTETASVIESLVEKGLVEVQGRSRDASLYRLTPAGCEHEQRNSAARIADLPALPVRSDRVRQVLEHLAQHGPARTRSIAQELEIPRISMNALMQYLKRKELVRKTDGGLHAPYEVTTAGRETGRALEAKFRD